MKETLRNLFRQKFNYSEYRKVILQNLLHAQELMREPEFLEETNDGDRIYGLGYLRDADGKEIGLYYTNVTKGDVRHKRVGFRKMMKKYTDFGVDAAITVFADKEHWRLSYMCDLKGGVTAAKRFSYIMGDGGMYVTPVNRLSELAGKRIKLEDIHDAFSVEALSDEFFKAYHDHYDIIVAALARLGMTGAIYHDYVKKMMGRIVFLHFLQKKGWLNGNPTFLRDLFFFSPHKDDFLDQVLEPLFFGIFNTEKGQREKLFASEHWDKNLLKEWESMPYLNGGLFERDEIDKMNIKLPASLFDDLFSFLASYNFTVDENDPDDAEIGVDPEMLGKIFESLLEDNKAKGAFYTPKEIVRYMCKESLIAHLASKLPDVADNVVRAFVESHEMQPELEPCRDDLESALREVKICDPAIGSGAFPMGLLNELWHCREALGTDMSRLQLKKEIIENNIYGVDIERGAIDIARLRFWLSIVVDSDKAEPLPNFDYKFMQGNSLIESYGGFDLSRIAGKTVGRPSTATQLVLGLDSDLSRKNLQRLLRDYFSVTDHQKKASMRQAINDEVKRLILNSAGGTPAFISKLNALDPSANQEFFLWHTWFKDIFDGGGFDIVIGNPPYVVVEANGKYRNYETESSLDLYAYFYERAVKLLKSNGIIAFITSSLFVKGLKYTSLRSFLENNVTVVAFRIEGDAVFENAGIPTATFIAQKAKGKWKFEDFYADKNMVDKIKRRGVPLSTISDIMRGFEIGRNMVSSEGYIKFLTGSDVIKYTYYKLSYISQAVLSAFSKEKSFFTKERILLRETGSSLTAVYLGDETIYSNRSLYSILITEPTLNAKYVLALLNSSLLQWYYATMFKGDTELFPKIRIAQAKQLPIFEASLEQQQPIIELVDGILEKKRANPNADTKHLEQEIDQKVYELYSLGPEEIAVIEQ
ncbi:MAG: TaqI-like C-terminal specificity domain-containing protein [Bacteroidales bacterium]|nr:TaqI-like C-terminal specificity domain-containing protein [Bacteroidales bacterium]